MPTELYFKALEATQRFHRRNKGFSGRFLLRYLADIRDLIEANGVTSLLDYGCGRAVVWRTPTEDGRSLQDVLGLSRVVLYDPGAREFESEPTGTFDMVICTQALGSIPVSDLPWVVDRLYSLAEKVVYVGERLGPVRKNPHKAIADQMPHGWTHQQWYAVLSRDSSRAEGWLRTADRASGQTRLEQVA